MTTTPSLGSPTYLDQLGVPRSLLEDIAIKLSYLHGEISTQALATHMKVSPLIAHELFLRLRKAQLVEVTGMTGGVHSFVASSAGKARAQELLRVNGYAGPAPVSLKSYDERVSAQTVRNLEICQDDVKTAFADLVLDEATLAQLGTAAVSGRAIFLHGPTGTGKTSVARRLAYLQANSPVQIPYAVEADGQIITVFDPTMHRPLPESSNEQEDRRWVWCERPTVIVGGELSISMLDLQFHDSTRYYTAPVQMRANNGLLVVDDFGRQRISPSELLNRWVVPLDRHVDYLTLAGGGKVDIPFDVFVVFATNLNPKELVDEAFLRRMQTKIKLDNIGREQFSTIFQRVCTDERLPFDPMLPERLADWIETDYQQPLRPCHPGDVINQVRWRAKLEGRTPELNEETLRAGCRNYFV